MKLLDFAKLSPSFATSFAWRKCPGTFARHTDRVLVKKTYRWRYSWESEENAASFGMLIAFLGVFSREAYCVYFPGFVT